jgi:para-aminobenzoate synthetase/4-amino-4-deoxychorismate lyase
VAHEPQLALRARDGKCWLTFSSPVEILESRSLSDVAPILKAVEEGGERGLWAAGFLTYEAAPAFDRAYAVHGADSGLPLVRFGLYEAPHPLAIDARDGDDAFTMSAWQPAIQPRDYRRAIERIKERIAAGDTYQANFTFSLHAAFQGSPWSFFKSLLRAQDARHSAYVDLGDRAICSASPELFFRLEGDRIVSRPMKGTAPRGLTWAEDRCRGRDLQSSEKNRAENLMIVDMVRNDLGRVAVPGSVRVSELYTVERYDTLFQMTSTVEARTEAPLPEILSALFPCASITGAPKVRTMEILKELELQPRGIYTGAIGYAAPGRQAEFNVAIRTATIDRNLGLARYGTGGGIVWDSSPGDEFEECRTKALILVAPRPRFRLLETLLWRPGRGYFLLDRHLARLGDSADYFQFTFSEVEVRRHLAEAGAGFSQHRRRVRLVLDEEGGVSLEATALPPHPGRRRWRVALASDPVDSSDRFLYHKTTHRQVYEQALAAVPGCDDVLLWNERGEVTESTVANLVVRLDGALLTPLVACGLLGGTYREHLLEHGSIREASIRLEDLDRADGLYLINSVRGWTPVSLVQASAEPLLPAEHGQKRGRL